ncbi:alpha/beta-hydrolase [Stipitochalara longipes BDJ]|nr:alpha/beta-hydrolase [Stipitochalara longipes BDJ]
MTSLPKYSFTHPTLGHLEGVHRSETVVQFRTIPYAHIPARFKQAVPITSLSPEERDCTEYGPACPQVPQNSAALGGPLPGEVPVWYDEEKCLNLTVSVPREVLEGKRGRVPVMVHVHGGGFVEGSHTQGARDTARMAELSAKEGMPVIVVSIHYRLHWLGFLSCSDLIAESKLSGDPSTNFGLYDQRLAFLWLQQHIPGFGGNAQEITAFGESAGSMSLAFHMCSTVPLFKRVILQSGTASSARPASFAQREEEYLRLLDFCGIERNDEQRLEKLRGVPVEMIVRGVQGIGVFSTPPTADERFFERGVPGFFTEAGLIGGCAWVEDVMVGESLYEGYLFAEATRNIEPEAFIGYLEKVFEKDGSEKVLSASQITRTMDRNLFWTRLNTLIGDVIFSAPTHNLLTTLTSPSFPSENGRKKIYRYNNALRNPFPGTPYYGVAGHHFVELAFQFLNFCERYPHPKLVDVSVEFARRLVVFANGREPWEEFEIRDGERIAVVNSGRGWRTYTREEDERVGNLEEEGGRRYAVWEALGTVYEQARGRGRNVFEELKMERIMALGRK